MWTRLLDKLVRGLVHHGRLVVEYPDGHRAEYGDGRGQPVVMRITDPAVPRRIMASPELGLGEAYMDGTLTIENDDLAGLIALLFLNREGRSGAWLQAPSHAARWLRRRYDQVNSAASARSNVAHHYDLSQALYDSFLDRDRQYSCAYFPTGHETLEDAQEAKKHLIARKLLLKPGMRVLDIGCGWGGMALTLAREYGAQVVGVTLSRDQHRIATERAEAAGLTGQVEFRLQDYRAVPETFDRIVSVGMFEHVGVPQYRTYFGSVREHLAPDGVALVHTIGRMLPPGTTSPWIRKYIFPGGYIPALSETAAAIERESLWITDIEVLRLHYAETLNRWYGRFMDAVSDPEMRAEVPILDDERFVRMWRFYLIASELTFRHGGHDVFQIQLARDQEAVPLTRDYMFDRTGTTAQARKHAAE
ncbi:MAG: class I SAM-dependent methyltransferase [Rhodobacteraceae bacterium]|nr:class I SAM-dependent methyltransferase [Paracoccaceae bacterium]